jgi:hypothetical protein
MQKLILFFCTVYLYLHTNYSIAADMQVESAPYIPQKNVSINTRKAAEKRLWAPMNRGVVVDLGNANVELKKQLRLKNRNKSFSTRAEQIGFARAVPTTDDWLIWHDVQSGGKVATLTVKSSDALGLRMGVLIKRLPITAELRFFAPDNKEQDFYFSAGIDILETIYRNLSSDDSEAARTYWSPIVQGTSIGLEIYLPAGIATDQVDISVPTISHIFQETLNLRDSLYSDYRSLNCELDYTCDASAWPVGNAVAKMQFVDNGQSYTCTGTLLNNTRNKSTPYFLTANHCISTQTVASSLITTWLYSSSVCNDRIAVNSAAIRRLRGATLLYATNSTDNALLKLNEDPPAGTSLAGWKVTADVIAQDGIGIHHPQGDLKKISYGVIEGLTTCLLTAEPTFSCATSKANNTHFNSKWTRGLTEPGSSGSGLFLTGGYLIGTLSGGSSNCATTGPDVYGRFDVAYSQALHTWLDPVSANTVIPTTPDQVDKTPLRSQTANIINYALLQISSPSTVSVSVAFETIDGTAIAGIDYVATQGIATIPTGEVSTVIPVEILSSRAILEDRTFYIRVYDPKGASFPVGVTELKVARSIRSNNLMTVSEQQIRRLQGLWQFNYPIINTVIEAYTLSNIIASTTDLGEYVVSGMDTYGNNDVIASYNTVNNTFSLLDSGDLFDRFYVFNADVSDNISGCYYQIDKTTSAFSKCYALTGQRSSASLRMLNSATEQNKDINQQHEIIADSNTDKTIANVMLNKAAAVYIQNYLNLKKQLSH